MERLLLAEGSSDLSDIYGSTTDVDFLRASGAVAQAYPIALAVWRLIDLGDRRSVRPVFDMLVARCVRMGFDSDPIHVVSGVLIWMMDPTCPTCHGRQFEAVPGTPTLSAHACPTCGGSGKRERDWGEHHHELHESILVDQRAAATAIVRKLMD